MVSIATPPEKRKPGRPPSPARDRHYCFLMVLAALMPGRPLPIPLLVAVTGVPARTLQRMIAALEGTGRLHRGYGTGNALALYPETVSAAEQLVAQRLLQDPQFGAELGSSHAPAAIRAGHIFDEAWIRSGRQMRHNYPRVNPDETVAGALPFRTASQMRHNYQQVVQDNDCTTAQDWRGSAQDARCAIIDPAQNGSASEDPSCRSAQQARCAIIAGAAPDPQYMPSASRARSITPRAHLRVARRKEIFFLTPSVFGKREKRELRIFPDGKSVVWPVRKQYKHAGKDFFSADLALRASALACARARDSALPGGENPGQVGQTGAERDSARAATSVYSAAAANETERGLTPVPAADTMPTPTAAQPSGAAADGRINFHDSRNNAMADGLRTQQNRIESPAATAGATEPGNGGRGTGAEARKRPKPKRAKPPVEPEIARLAIEAADVYNALMQECEMRPHRALPRQNPEQHRDWTSFCKLAMAAKLDGVPVGDYVRAAFALPGAKWAGERRYPPPNALTRLDRLREWRQQWIAGIHAGVKSAVQRDEAFVKARRGGVGLEALVLQEARATGRLVQQARHRGQEPRESAVMYGTTLSPWWLVQQDWWPEVRDRVMAQQSPARKKDFAKAERSRRYMRVKILTAGAEGAAEAQRNRKP